MVDFEAVLLSILSWDIICFYVFTRFFVFLSRFFMLFH